MVGPGLMGKKVYNPFDDFCGNIWHGSRLVGEKADNVVNHIVSSGAMLQEEENNHVRTSCRVAAYYGDSTVIRETYMTVVRVSLMMRVLSVVRVSFMVRSSLVIVTVVVFLLVIIIKLVLVLMVVATMSRMLGLGPVPPEVW